MRQLVRSPAALPSMCCGVTSQPIRSTFALVQLNQACVRRLALLQTTSVLRHPTSARLLCYLRRGRDPAHALLHAARKRLTTALPGNWTLDTRHSEARPKSVRLPSAAAGSGRSRS